MRDLNYQLKHLCTRNRDGVDQKDIAVAGTLCYIAVSIIYYTKTSR